MKFNKLRTMHKLKRCHKWFKSKLELNKKIKVNSLSK